MKDGTLYQPKQFERPDKTPGNMRNLALRELTEKRGSKKQRARRSLRIFLPAWLSGKAIQDSQEMEKEIK